MPGHDCPSSHHSKLKTLQDKYLELIMFVAGFKCITIKSQQATYISHSEIAFFQPDFHRQLNFTNTHDGTAEQVQLVNSIDRSYLFAWRKPSVHFLPPPKWRIIISYMQRNQALDIKSCQLCTHGVRTIGYSVMALNSSFWKQNRTGYTIEVSRMWLSGCENFIPITYSTYIKS